MAPYELPFRLQAHFALFERFLCDIRFIHFEIIVANARDFERIPQCELGEGMARAFTVGR